MSGALTNIVLFVHKIDLPHDVKYLLFKLRYTKNINRDNDEYSYLVMLLEWLFKNITQDDINKDLDFLLILHDYFLKNQYNNKLNESYNTFLNKFNL